MSRFGENGTEQPRRLLAATPPDRHPHRVDGDRLDAQQRVELGIKIRKARKGRGWTQAELADQALVAATLVGKAERGVKVSTTTLRAILSVLPEIGVALADPEPSPAYPPDLRTDEERALWDLLRRLEERDRWICIYILRAHDQRRNESAPPQTG